MTTLIVVESPTKAKTLGKYTDTTYKILASYGHVRDLPSKPGSVRPAEGFAFTWKVVEKSHKHLVSIEKEARSASSILLATDPDREGEAIAWHIATYLKEQGITTPTARIAFHSITPSAIKAALAAPRAINESLVHAYLARLSLDYLVGFTLSPLLWRKLPGSRSAGRVQSVALRFAADLEHARETFVPQPYWSIKGFFSSGKTKDAPVEARLAELGGKKVDKFFFKTQEEASLACAKAQEASIYHVVAIQKKEVKRNPAAPFITSTLQQEGSRRLNLRTGQVMSLAQQLYEQGLITYMRTDSVHIVPEAIQAARHYIQATWGDAYLPQDPRSYAAKVKNAQEAHEAIRPTDLSLTPENVSLDASLRDLYALIWKRTIASQMQSAMFEQTKLTLRALDVVFSLTGSVLCFDGFLILYQDDPEEEDTESVRLPLLQERDVLTLKSVSNKAHITEPPLRYSEATLVKKMEEQGIGRPSTYARILSVLTERGYVTVEKRTLVPKELGRFVTAFLESFCTRYVQYDFTATLEEQLDEIARGERNWKEVLKEFWNPFQETVHQAMGMSMLEILYKVQHALWHYIFGSEHKVDTKLACPKCKVGILTLKWSKGRAFVGCSTYPSCNHIQSLAAHTEEGTPSLEAESAQNLSAALIIGEDPTTQETITLRRGPYGPYLQWGEGTKPARVSLPKAMQERPLSLEEALSLKGLPRTLGKHPEGGNIVAGIGPFGPYLKVGTTYTSLKEGDVRHIGLEEALVVLENAAKKPKRTLERAKRTRKSDEKAELEAKA